MIEHDLWLKDNFKNRNIVLLYNRVIIEYDLRSAGINLCEEYHLLDKDDMKKLRELPKKDATVQLGKMQIKNTKLKEGLKSAFQDIRRRFFEENSLEKEDILSVKKDAIFTLKEVPVTKFGICEFARKNQYSAFMRLGELEFYYNYDKLDVKGIGDDVLDKHKDYMLHFIHMLFYKMENDTEYEVKRYFTRFYSRYKLRELELGYYREFSVNSNFRVIEDDVIYDNEAFIPYDDKRYRLDIGYNFQHILLPLVILILDEDIT